MKRKTTTIFILLCLSLCLLFGLNIGRAQILNEGFEATTFPPAGWISARGQNGLGTAFDWVRSTTNPQGGSTAHAFVRYENVTGGIAEDWLITPRLLPNAGQKDLTFWMADDFGTDFGSVYTVRVSTGSQFNLAAFITVASYTEEDLQNDVYTQFTIDLSAYNGQPIFVAFVMSNDDGDSFFLDNVSGIPLAPPPACAPSTNVSTQNISNTSASIAWTAGGGTTWNINWAVAGVITNPGTGQGNLVANSSTNPYPLTGLSEGTDYVFYIQDDCGGGQTSEWIGPFSFRTTAPGTTCANSFIISSLPFTQTGFTTQGFGDDYDDGDACGSFYMTGDDFVFAYTPATDETVSITLSNTDDWVGVFVTQGCPDAGGSCVALNTNFEGNPAIDQVSLAGGTTYFIIISTFPSPQSTAFDIDIQPIACPSPSNLGVQNVGLNSAELTWASSETSFNINWAEEGIITTPGTGQGNLISNTTDNPYLLTSLNSQTVYTFYVQSACGSDWAGPFTFNTRCNPVTAFPWNEGFESDFGLNCWTVLDINGDNDTWRLYEGANARTGNRAVRAFTDFNSANNDWLISPALVLDGNQRLRFWTRAQSANEPDELQVLLSTTGTAPANFTEVLLASTPINFTTYQEFILDLSAYSGTIYFAFVRNQPPADGWYVYIDDVRVEAIPTCPEPTDLAISGITATTAQVDFSSEPGEVFLVYGPTGFDPATEGTSLAATSNPFTLTNLSPETAYQVYAYLVCEGGEQSPLAGPVSFNTPCVPPVVSSFPYLENFDGETAPALPCGWTVENVNGDSFTWISYANEGQASSNAAGVRWNSVLAMNDWLFSPEVQLEAGVAYRVSFSYRVASAFFPENLALFYGNAANATAMSNELSSQTGLANTTYQTETITLTPANSGAFFFGFHGFSEADQFQVFVDNFEIHLVPQVSLSADVLQGTEATQTVITLTATSNTPVEGNQSLNLNVSGTNITASDYVLSASSLTILDGQTTATATFTIQNDGLAEGEEVALVSLSNPSAGIVLSDDFEVALTIVDNDNAPVANNDTYTTELETMLEVDVAGGILSNDTDADGQSLTAILVQNVAQGTLTLNTNGSFSYTPPTAFTGEVSFTYQASDGTNSSSVATVLINVTPPSALEDPYLAAGTTVSPNPSAGIFLVKMDFVYLGGVMLRTFDAQGRLVHTTKVQKIAPVQGYELDLRSVASGNLYLQLETETGRATKRLIKE
ncbi:MAG: cadherin-like domain-containing protein [Microscillaceae bacterium]|nr:cadherin-like domain-containing protein [Microscillaceae bacterium]